LTAERFVPDPFSGEPGARMYRTGDVARYRADGVLEFLGRLDHQVKISGFRVELGEIESVLRSHPAVRDAAVCAIERGGDKTLYAHVVLAAAQAVDERGVRTYLETKLPKYMLPARVEFLECLPMHSSGKVDRMRLVELATPAVPKSGGPPQQLAQGARTRTIAACWREVLGSADAPDLDENFFDAGGDSLRLIAFHARLQRELRLELGIVDLFEHCTVRKLAAFVNARVA
jgi:aryl carrier-like protein